MGFETGLKIESAPMWVIIMVSILWVISSIWIMKDSKSRNKNPIVLFCFHTIAGWPLSVFWWIYLRPEIKEDIIK